MKIDKPMKKILFSFILCSFVLFMSLNVFAATGTPGDPPGEPSGGTPIGGGAPIGSGTVILMGLAAAYGARKLYLTDKEELED